MSEKTIEQDIVTGEIIGNCTESFQGLVSNLYLPLFQEQQSWGKASEESTKQLLSGTVKLNSVLAEAVSAINRAVILAKPDAQYVEQFDLRPGALMAAAADPIVSSHFLSIIQDWCKRVQALLSEDANSSASTELGPDSELDFWKSRLATFNGIVEELKCKECKLVIGINNHMQSDDSKLWKTLDLKTRDAANEARDNVRYLSTLENSFETMYKGSPQDILDGLKHLMMNVMTLFKIARYYGSPERMTTLLVKVSNQIVANCREHILAPGKIWDQDRLCLIANMQVCCVFVLRRTMSVAFH